MFLVKNRDFRTILEEPPLKRSPVIHSQSILHPIGANIVNLEYLWEYSRWEIRYHNIRTNIDLSTFIFMGIFIWHNLWEYLWDIRAFIFMGQILGQTLGQIFYGNIYLA
jgi:hypothetical protein